VKSSFRQSFARDLKKIPDRAVLNRIKQVIQDVERSNTFQDVKGVKKMSTAGSYFRIRVGDYRIGVVIEED
jgi:mRNA interferase RelE/StbE